MVSRKNLWPFLLLLGVCLGLFIHLFVVRQQQRRKNGKLPLFATRDQRIYRSATHSEPTQTLMDQWKTLASGSFFHGYNLGTHLAIDSVVSGEVQDIGKLQQAQAYLSGAVALDTTNNKELLHNLEVVTNLLQNTQQQSSGSSSQSAPSSGENAQSQNSSGGSGAKQSMNTQTSSGSQDSQEAQQRSSETSLSEATKKQLENYQQQLEKEQAQNQDFYNKQQLPTSISDPFSVFSQFFGEDPLLDQHIGTTGKKDW